MKNILLALLSFIISPFVLAQNEFDEYQIWLEEFGEVKGTQLLSGSDPVSEGSTWTSIADAPNVFGRSTAGVIGDYLYIHTSQSLNSLAIALYLPTMTWVASTSCLYPSFNNAYCVANGELYKLSGSGFEKFTPAGDGTGTWTSLTNGPSTITNAQNSMTWDGGSYIYVQSSSSSSPYTSYLQRYHITNGTWEARTGSTYPRRYAGMTYLNGFIYMIGGLLSDGSPANICQKYDVATDTWSQIASAPEVLNFTKWTVTNDGYYVYLVGSGGGYSSWPLSDKVYYYDPVADIWTFESTLPAPRGLAMGLFVPGYFKMFLGGGNDGTGGTAYQNDCWEGTGGPYIPVELASLTAEASGNNVLLSWMTATETNNSHFAVERSADNKSFTQIGSVKGFGTTTTPQYYTFKDENLSAGNYFYRLKQFDIDGKFRYSQIVETQIAPAGFSLEQNYPNPFNPSTKIKFSIPQNPVSGFTNVTLKIYDMLGNEIAVLVNESKPSGIYEISFDASVLSSGIYFYKLQAGAMSEIRKMTLLR
jgi:hypothetical protein